MSFVRDLRVGAYSLIRTPGLAVAVVLTLALGIGVTADIDDAHVVQEPTLTIYSPFDESLMFGGRLFIHTGANPYALVPSVMRIIR